jgi:hypothetical protein
MSAFKGAPGPWYLDGEGVRALVRDASGVIVAVRHRMPGHKNETNMRLIAAAPELLEACQALMDATDEDGMTNSMLLGCAIEMAGNAIAKATGEQP